MDTRELSLLKVKEGIDVAVTMHQRKGKAVPCVITNTAGVPEIIENQ